MRNSSNTEKLCLELLSKSYLPYLVFGFSFSERTMDGKDWGVDMRVLVADRGWPCFLSQSWLVGHRKD